MPCAGTNSHSLVLQSLLWLALQTGPRSPGANAQARQQVPNAGEGEGRGTGNSRWAQALAANLPKRKGGKKCAVLAAAAGQSRLCRVTAAGCSPSASSPAACAPAACTPPCAQRPAHGNPKLNSWRAPVCSTMWYIRPAHGSPWHIRPACANSKPHTWRPHLCSTMCPAPCTWQPQAQ